MWQFVPLSDDMLYGAGGPPGPLVPYRLGVACWHALSDVAQPQPQQQPAAARFAAADCEAQRCTDSVSPGFTPSFSAMPALSSSTYCAAPLDG